MHASVAASQAQLPLTDTLELTRGRPAGVHQRQPVGDHPQAKAVRYVKKRACTPVWPQPLESIAGWLHGFHARFTFVHRCVRPVASALERDSAHSRPVAPDPARPIHESLVPKNGTSARVRTVQSESGTRNYRRTIWRFGPHARHLPENEWGAILHARHLPAGGTLRQSWKGATGAHSAAACAAANPRSRYWRFCRMSSQSCALLPRRRRRASRLNLHCCTALGFVCSSSSLSLTLTRTRRICPFEQRRGADLIALPLPRIFLPRFVTLRHSAHVFRWQPRRRCLRRAVGRSMVRHTYVHPALCETPTPTILDDGAM